MDDDEPAMGIPEWVVTFGDMMSLLLTFFIMLVSMSEMKEDDDKVKAMVDSLQRRFGYEYTPDSSAPGSNRPRPSAYRPLATVGRAKKTSTHSGGVPTQAPAGDNARVRIIRPGQQTAVGTVLFFGDGAIEVSDENKRLLDGEVAQLAGKPQKIEIRGHTSQEAAGLGASALDPMDLAYRRCRTVMAYLVEKHNIPAERIRMSTAGSHEPMYMTADPDKNRLNPRVEVFLLEETVDQLVGTQAERKAKIVGSESNSDEIQ
jgi:chemotaxis protein MotB